MKCKMDRKRLMTEMTRLRDIAIEYSDYCQCDGCIIHDVCDNSYVLLGCAWLYLAGVATGRLYRTGRIRKTKNYRFAACNELFDQAAAFRKKYQIDCNECPISKECTQLACHCYYSFLLCVIFGVIDVNGERKETEQ